MGKIKVNFVLGAVIFAFCLLFISNYIGNALIPSSNTNHVTKSINRDWIKWPEPKNTPAVEPKDKKSDVRVVNTEKTPPTSEKSVTALLLSVGSVKGEKVARKCVACHSFNKGGKNKIGPNLYGIMGRKRATTVGYNYSKALKKMGGKWGFTDMDKFLLKPRNFLPGTKMSFRGIKSASDRAAIIMYLRSFAEIPLTLPK